MCQQDDSQKRRDIIQSIRKLDSDISALNQQKQQLLRELKSAPISEGSVTSPEEGFQRNPAIVLHAEPMS